MPIEKNIGLKDKLIKKTTNKASITSKGSIANIKSKLGMPSHNPGTDTYKTKKMTFFVKETLLERLYNFAHWDRHSVTEAFNIALEDGLRGKNTKPRQKE